MNPSFTQFFTTLLKKTPYESYLKAEKEYDNIKDNLIGIIFSRFFVLGFILNAFSCLLSRDYSIETVMIILFGGVLSGLCLGFFGFLLSLGAEDFFLRLFKKTRQVRNHYFSLQKEMEQYLSNSDFQHAFSIYMTEYIKEFKHADSKTEKELKKFLVEQYDVIKKSLINKEYKNALSYFQYLFIKLQEFGIDLIYQHKEGLFHEVDISYREQLNLPIEDNHIIEKEINANDIDVKFKGYSDYRVKNQFL